MDKSSDDRLEVIPSRVGPEEKESGDRDVLSKTQCDDGPTYRGFSSSGGTVEPQYPLDPNCGLDGDPVHNIAQDCLKIMYILDFYAIYYMKGNYIPGEC